MSYAKTILYYNSTKMKALVFEFSTLSKFTFAAIKIRRIHFNVECVSLADPFLVLLLYFIYLAPELCLFLHLMVDVPNYLIIEKVHEEFF